MKFYHFLKYYLGFYEYSSWSLEEGLLESCERDRQALQQRTQCSESEGSDADHLAHFAYATGSNCIKIVAIWK